MIAFTIIAYFGAEYVFSIFFGWDIPIVGPVGVEPFDFMRSYGVLIGGIGASLVFYLLSRRMKK